MPSLATRIAPSDSRTVPFSENHPSAPMIESSALSATGNPAPTRGLLPPELMYDFDILKLFPNSPYLTRGLVDVNETIRNTALQALVAAGVTV